MIQSGTEFWKRTGGIMIAAAMVLGAAGCGSSSSGTSTAASSVVESTAVSPAAESITGSSTAESTGGATSQASSDTGNDMSGSITLYTSAPEEDAQQLIDAFNAEYPEITVNVFRSGTEEVISKIQAEKEANSIQADVLLLSDAVTFESLKDQDLLESYESPELANIDEQYYDADHTYTGTKIITTGIGVNTDVISESPVSFKDLLKSEYKDQIAMASPLYSGAAAYNLSVLTRTDGLGWEFYQGLKDNNAFVGKGNGSVQEVLTSGEKGIGIIVDYMVLRAKAEGAPLEFVYPEEGSLCVTEPIGIVKDSPNEALAEHFVDFILSENGQKTVAEIGYTPVRKGVAAPEGFKSADEITPLSGDMETLISERENDKSKFADMFGDSGNE